MVLTLIVVDRVLVILMRHLTTSSVNLIQASCPLRLISSGGSCSSLSRLQKELVLQCE